MSTLDLDFWRKHGWHVPSEFEINKRATSIDYTVQYLLSFPMNESVADKSKYLQDLIPKIQAKIEADLNAEDEGELNCLEKINFHLGEIEDGEYFEVEYRESNSLVCDSCGKHNSPMFQICWMCGSSLDGNLPNKAFANVFVELTVGVLNSDLVEYQYETGPIDYKEMIWEDLNREEYRNLCKCPASSFKLIEDDSGDFYLYNGTFVIFVRFNKDPMVKDE